MDDIGSNTRIPVFLDHDLCGCSLGIERDQSVTDSADLTQAFTSKVMSINSSRALEATVMVCFMISLNGYDD